MGVTFIKPRSVLRALQGLLGCKDLTEVDSSLVTAGQEGFGDLPTSKVNGGATVGLWPNPRTSWFSK